MIINNYNNTEYHQVSILTVDKLAEHLGHELTASNYSDGVKGESDSTVLNYSLECVDCSEILADFDINNPNEE